MTISMSCLGLLFVFCNSVWSEDEEKATPRVKELQQRRLEVLEAAHDSAKQLYANARVSYEEVHTVSAELLAARLAYAETQKERIDACDQAVQEATQWVDRAAAMVQSNRTSRLTVLKAQAYLLETQIMRENLGASE
jgi:hypothetical protein